jgi:hypothetical protein
MIVQECADLGPKRGGYSLPRHLGSINELHGAAKGGGWALSVSPDLLFKPVREPLEPSARARS